MNVNNKSRRWSFFSSFVISRQCTIERDGDMNERRRETEKASALNLITILGLATAQCIEAKFDYNRYTYSDDDMFSLCSVASNRFRSHQFFRRITK